MPSPLFVELLFELRSLRGALVVFMPSISPLVPELRA